MSILKALSNLSAPCLVCLDNAKHHRTKPVSTPSACRLKKAQFARGSHWIWHSIFGAKDTVATLRQGLKAYVETVVPSDLFSWQSSMAMRCCVCPHTTVTLQPIEMAWSEVKGEVGRQHDTATTMQIVKQRMEAAFEHLRAGRIQNLYAHVRKI